MGGDDILTWPAHGQAEAIATARVSSTELLELTMRRIEEWNPSVNAVVAIDAERAANDARRADEAVATGARLGPFHGVPMTVKDTIAVAGLPATAGAVERRNAIPAADAVAVARLRAAGAVVVGKTNVPRDGADVHTHNAVYGSTRNPWNVARTPGGSSGGSAAAVATGMSALDIGGDIAGSIRLPANYCGVYGHKPSYGIVPETGQVISSGDVLVPSDLTVTGPLARSGRDLATSLLAIAGPSGRDALGYSLTLPPPRHKSIRGYRLAAWWDDRFCPLEPEVGDVVERTVENLRAEGISVECRRPDVDFACSHRLYERLLYGALSRGAPSVAVSMAALVPASLPVGAAIRAASTRHRGWLDAVDGRELLRRVWDRFFTEFDALLLPVSPVAAPEVDERGGPLTRRMATSRGWRSCADQFRWVGVPTVAYLPATAVPVGFTPDGLPVGMQVVSAYLEDLTAIDVAGRLGALLGAVRCPPGPRRAGCRRDARRTLGRDRAHGGCT